MSENQKQFHSCKHHHQNRKCLGCRSPCQQGKRHQYQEEIHQCDDDIDNDKIQCEIGIPLNILRILERIDPKPERVPESGRIKQNAEEEQGTIVGKHRNRQNKKRCEHYRDDVH